MSGTFCRQAILRTFVTDRSHSESGAVLLQSSIGKLHEQDEIFSEARVGLTAARSAEQNSFFSSARQLVQAPWSLRTSH